MKRRLRLLVGSVRLLRNEPTAVVCFATLMLIISHYQGSNAFFQNTFGSTFSKHPAYNALAYLWWFGSSVFFYMLIPLVFSKATNGTFFRKYGLGLGDWKMGLLVSAIFIGVMVPAVFIASRSQAFHSAYPLAGSGAYTLYLEKGAQVSLWLFLIYELGYCAYFVAWEFLYRGWMLNAVLPSWGKTAAVLVQTAPFAVMHLGKPELESVGSIIAGVALGVLALRTRSFWYGAIIHCTVAVAMDIFSAGDALFPK